MTMTHDEFVARSCTSKLPFEGGREARTWAKKMTNRYGGGRLSAYRCHVADEHWHVGHSVPKSKARRA